MFSLTHQPIQADHLTTQLKDIKCGAFVSFEGWVRNHNQGKAVTALHYEAHEKLAVQVGKSIITDALNQYEIDHALCHHRVGELSVSEMAIWVGVSAGHRGAAFAACEYILNRIKAEVPIWKNEFYKDGESGWVEANHCC